MSDLIDTTQMYLRTVYELAEQGTPPRRARIAERLGQAAPTVSQTVSRMERDGLLVLTDNRDLELTPSGLEEASTVMRRHRLAECLLVEVLKVDWDLAHDEACRWEHVISGEVEAKLATALGNPTHTPYGTPIPRTGQDPAGFSQELTPLSARQASDASGASFSLTAVDESIQADPALLRELLQAGLVPGARVRVDLADGQTWLVGPSGRLPHSELLGRGLYVTE